MTNWPVKTLGDICLDIDRRDPKESSLPEFTYIDLSAINQTTKQIDGPRILTTADAPGRARQLVQTGDVLVSTVRPNLNAVALVGSNLDGATASTGFCVLRPNPSAVEPGLLFAWVRNQSFINELTEQAKGASYPAVTDSIVKSRLIPIPPLDEQKRIVSLLDDATARITELTACYEQARTHANNLFTSALRDSLAPLESWPVKRLGDLCLFVRGPFGGSLKKSIFAPTGYAVYEQQHAIYERFNQFRYFISEDKFQEMNRFEVFPGDILMSCSGTIGKTAIVPSGAPAGIINQALLKLSCLEKLDNQYLCIWMRSSYFQEAVLGSAGGAALQNVASVAILKNIPIALPLIEEQKRIVARLDSMRAKTAELVAAYDAKLQAAKNLRQSILEAAFAGEL
jgi:type I restriction enzyme S subunit